jgi:Uncharacterized protein conserved in bacteria
MASDNKITMRLHHEKLDIAKKLVQICEVSVHKETLTEEKNITVPVSREVLVIERKLLNSEGSSRNNETPEIIRIPISEEQN